MAGLVAQRQYRARKLARPNHDFPDIVMKSGNRLFFVESKATLSEDSDSAINAINSELPRMVSYTSSCVQMDKRPIVGLLIGTNIISESEFCANVMEIELL